MLAPRSLPFAGLACLALPGAGGLAARASRVADAPQRGVIAVSRPPAVRGRVAALAWRREPGGSDDHYRSFPRNEE